MRDLFYPAEWETQEATWLAFPHNKKNWYGERLVLIREFYFNLIRTIAQFQKVKVLIPSAEILTPQEKAQFYDTRFPVELIEIPTDDIWIRDYGPFFLKHNFKKVIGQTEFNAWGEKFPPWENDNKVPEKIAKHLNITKIKSSSYIFEGGAIEVNGDGLGITTLDCLVGKTRNNPKHLNKIRTQLSQLFGLKNLLILPKGLVGDHTDGHIDNVARFVAKNRIVVASEKNEKSPNASILAETKYFLECFLRAYYPGNFKVDTLQLPPQRTLEDGQILPASYMNFIYANGALIYPKYKCPMDAVAKKYFQSVYPDKKIIGIDSRTVIEEGGSLHCMSKHEFAMTPT